MAPRFPRAYRGRIATRGRQGRVGTAGRSVVVEDRAEAAILGEQRIAAVAEQVQVERLVGLLLVVAVDDNRDRLLLAGGEGQRAGLGDVVAVARRGGAVLGAERQRHGVVRG